eukprot:3807918-Pleurochrysis_carterae.AAC.2
MTQPSPMLFLLSKTYLLSLLQLLVAPNAQKSNHSLTLRETPVGCTAADVALRVAARQRCACFEASYQRQNELTKQSTKQTAADD